jgi:hypothetical protein
MQLFPDYKYLILLQMFPAPCVQATSVYILPLKPEANIYMESVKKAIPVTVRGGLWGCEMLRALHCLESRLIYGGYFVSLSRSPPLYSSEIFSASGTNFC